MEEAAKSTEDVMNSSSTGIQQIPPNQGRGGKVSMRMSELPLTMFETIVALCIFGTFAIALLGIYLSMPRIDHNLLKLPRTVSELRILT